MKQMNEVSNHCSASMAAGNHAATDLRYRPSLVRKLKMRIGKYQLRTSIRTLKEMLDWEDPLFCLGWERVLASNTYAAMQMVAVRALGLSVVEARVLRPASDWRGHLLLVQPPEGRKRVVLINTELQRQALSVLKHYVLSEAGEDTCLWAGDDRS